MRKWNFIKTLKFSNRVCVRFYRFHLRSLSIAVRLESTALRKVQLACSLNAHPFVLCARSFHRSEYGAEMWIGWKLNWKSFANIFCWELRANTHGCDALNLCSCTIWQCDYRWIVGQRAWIDLNKGECSITVCLKNRLILRKRNMEISKLDHLLKSSVRREKNMKRNSKENNIIGRITQLLSPRDECK